MWYIIMIYYSRNIFKTINMEFMEFMKLPDFGHSVQP